MDNKTKQKLREGKAVIGSAVQIDNLLTIEVMGKAGLVFLLIDTQHGVSWGMFTSTLQITDQWLSQRGQIGIVGGDLGLVTECAAQSAHKVEGLLARLNGARAD